jgi:TolA-binding protein
MENMVQKVSFLAVAAIAIGITIAGCDARQKNADFEPIRQLVCQSKFADAIPKLEAYRGKHEFRAGLFLGKAYLGLGQIDKARAAFEKTVRRFPDTLEAHKCQYKLAMLTFLDGDQQAARVQFSKISNGPLTGEAAAFVRFLK